MASKIDYQTFKKMQAGIYSPAKQLELNMLPDRQLELFGNNATKIADYQKYLRLQNSKHNA